MNFFKKIFPPKPEPIIPVEVESTDYKALYKNLKKEYERYQKTIENQKKEEKEQLKVSNSTLQELAEKKKLLFESSNLIKEQKEQIEQLEIILIEQKKENQTLNEKNRLLLEEKERVGSTLSSMKQRQDSSIQRAHSFETELKKSKGRERLLHEELKRHEQTLLKRERKIKELEKTIDQILIDKPSFLLEHASELLNANNVHEYQGIVDLYKRVNQLKGWKILNQSNKQHIIQEKKAYGYLVKHSPSKQSFRFVTTDSKTYEIVGHQIGRLKVGLAVSAIVDDTKNTAYITWQYETHDEMNREKDIQQPKTIKHKPKPKEQYPHIGPIKVLLVTNKNGIRYRERLTKHGVVAEWMDPYEKSFTHIRTKVSSYDIIILLEDAMPHEARQLITEFQHQYPDKVQSMFNHNENAIVARIRYVAFKQGWLKPTSELSSSI